MLYKMVWVCGWGGAGFTRMLVLARLRYGRAHVWEGDCTSYILYDVLYMPFHIYTGLRAVDIWNWWVYCILCDELHIVEHICTALTAMDIC